MFQPSRFELEIPVLRGCPRSSRLISKSPVLRETCPNFQLFVKIPICIASYFVFWCFNCVYIAIQLVFAVIHCRFCKKRTEKRQNYIFKLILSTQRSQRMHFPGFQGCQNPQFPLRYHGPTSGRHWLHYKPPILGNLGVGTQNTAVLCHINHFALT